MTTAVRTAAITVETNEMDDLDLGSARGSSVRIPSSGTWPAGDLADFRRRMWEFIYFVPQFYFVSLVTCLLAREQSGPSRAPSTAAPDVERSATPLALLVWAQPDPTPWPSITRSASFLCVEIELSCRLWGDS